MSNSRQTRLVLVSMCVMFIGVIAFLWWNCAANRKINFLSHRHGAKWIVYSYPPSAMTYRPVEFSAEFRKSFSLDSIPPNTKLAVRAFKRCEIRINSATISLPEIQNKNWKQVRTVDVSKNLHAGGNEISVTVWNGDGPPALWLSMDDEKQILKTDESWNASFAGAEWHSASLAGAPREPRSGNFLFYPKTTTKSFARVWPLLILFAVISSVFVWIFSKCLRPAPTSLTSRTPLSFLKENPIVAVLALFAALWFAMFTHNLKLLPSLVGFDVLQHLEYVKYVGDHKSLPLANEGFEMFQPPLYYIASAVVLKIFDLSINDSGVALLRWLGFLIGVVHFIFVWLSLRLLFAETRKQLVGLVLAAFLPMQIYMGHYVSNESLAALLVGASIYFCLRILRAEKTSPKLGIALGICIGAAMLAKLTAILVIPAILAALAVKLFSQRERRVAIWFEQLVAPSLIALVVCGWHYARVWSQFGSPFIGNWDAQAGFGWWQEDGYRTVPYFARFGKSLVNPLFGGFNSFGDGIYSTLWGDGLCGGASLVSYRPPWNFDLVFAGSLLALVPTVAIGFGAIRMVSKFVRELKAEQFLLLGFSASVVFAVIFMSLKVPSYAQVKSFYGLSALVPLCAFCVLGFDFVMQRSKTLLVACSVLLGVWALNSYASHWILANKAAPEICSGLRAAANGEFDLALKNFSRAHQFEPNNLEARLYLSRLLAQLGRKDEARQLVEDEIALDDSQCRFQLAAIFAEQENMELAVAHARKAIELGSENTEAYQNLSAWLLQAGRKGEAIVVARKGLAIAPLSEEMQSALAAALETQRGSKP